MTETRSDRSSRPRIKVRPTSSANHALGEDAGPRSGAGPVRDALRGWRPQAFSHAVTCPDQVDHLNATGGISVHFARLGRDPVHLEFSGAQTRTLSVWATAARHGFLTTPKVPADLFTLRFVTHGSLIRHNRRSEAVIARVDFGTLVDFEDMDDEQASAGFASMSAAVSSSSIAAAMLALDEAVDPQRFAPVAEIKTIGLHCLRQTLCTIQARLRDGAHDFDLLAPMLEELLVYQLISAWPRSPIGCEPTLAAAPSRALSRALEYMEANLSNRMTLAEVAQASGVGVRALQLAFKRELGCSPISHLIDRRLDRVHEALRNTNEEKIRDVALRWGFVHMGDFGRRYRQKFGCSPGASQRR